MNHLPSAQHFPTLCQAAIQGNIRHQFEIRESPPPVDLISNVNLVPFADDGVLMIRLQDGQWDIPGGTLEPGESYLDTICRELLEEAGARLLTFEPFGAWRYFSFASEPYRPHLPHPEFYRVVGWGEVMIVGQPQNPQGGEQIIDVACVAVEKASQRFLAVGRPDLAELYRLAAAIRQARLDQKRPSLNA